MCLNSNLTNQPFPPTIHRELLEFVAEVVEKERRVRYWKYGLIAAVVLLVLFALSTFGLVWAVVELSRDTSVSNDVLVTKGSENSIATRNTGFHAEKGVFFDDTTSDNSTIVATSSLHENILLSTLPATYQSYQENLNVLNEYLEILNNMPSITVLEDGDPALLSVQRVSKASILANSSLHILTTSGDGVLIDLDGTMTINGNVLEEDQDVNGRKLLFLNKIRSAARWAGGAIGDGAGYVNRNIIKPVTCSFNKDMCEFIQEAGEVVGKEAAAYFKELQYGPQNTFNAAKTYISNIGACAKSVSLGMAYGQETDEYNRHMNGPTILYCQQFIPCLNILAPMGTEMSSDEYWDTTGELVKQDLEKCIKGNYIVCFKYKKCIKTLLTVTGTMPKPVKG